MDCGKSSEPVVRLAMYDEDLDYGSLQIKRY
jgi:hypothetical protein